MTVTDRDPPPGEISTLEPAVAGGMALGIAGLLMGWGVIADILLGNAYFFHAIALMLSVGELGVGAWLVVHAGLQATGREPRGLAAAAVTAVIAGSILGPFSCCGTVGSVGLFGADLSGMVWMLQAFCNLVGLGCGISLLLRLRRARRMSPEVGPQGFEVIVDEARPPGRGAS